MQLHVQDPLSLSNLSLDVLQLSFLLNLTQPKLFISLKGMYTINPSSITMLQSKTLNLNTTNIFSPNNLPICIQVQTNNYNKRKLKHKQLQGTILFMYSASRILWQTLDLHLDQQENIFSNHQQITTSSNNVFTIKINSEQTSNWL